jgi:ketosteroid isomerase-like protein
MRWDAQDYILAGDRAFSLRTVRGKSADGEELDYQGCDIYRVQGDKIVYKNTFWKIVEHKERL